MKYTLRNEILQSNCIRTMNITSAAQSRTVFLIVNGGEVFAQVLGHGESLQLVGTKEFGHLFVGDEVLFVLRILEIVVLDIGPKMFNALSSGGFFHANDGS